MSFARLIHDYIDDFAASDDGAAFEEFEDFDDDIDGDDHSHARQARRHRRSSRRGSQRRGSRARARRDRGSRGHGRGGSTRDLVRLVVLTAIAISVIRRLRSGSRRRHRREYA